MTFKLLKGRVIFKWDKSCAPHTVVLLNQRVIVKQRVLFPNGLVMKALVHASCTMCACLPTGLPPIFSEWFKMDSKWNSCVQMFEEQTLVVVAWGWVGFVPIMSVVQI